MMQNMPTALTARETSEVARANQSGKQPVVFIPGLGLLASEIIRPEILATNYTNYTNESAIGNPQIERQPLFV